MNVLLITTNMGGYVEDLIQEMETKGLNVDFFPHGSKIPREKLGFIGRVFRSLYKDFKIELFHKLNKKKESKIYKEYIKELKDSYDYVFDFGGKSRVICLDLLKKKYKSKYILYLWDDLKYSDNAWSIKDYFDEKYIFNRVEADEYGFHYRANFFTNKFRYSGEEKDIDIYYKGNFRDPFRSRTIRAIDDCTPDLVKHLILFNKHSYLHNIMKVDKKENFYRYVSNEFTKMEDLANFYKRSKVLLDIAYKNQSGLGLRPIEAIAANCKLITTNENIKNYEFYNENNIFILKDNYDEIKKFLEKPYIEPSAEIKHKYSITGFVEEIFQL